MWYRIKRAWMRGYSWPEDRLYSTLIEWVHMAQCLVRALTFNFVKPMWVFTVMEWVRKVERPYKTLGDLLKEQLND